MKTIKFIVILLFIMIQIQEAYSYKIYINHPCDNSEYPTQFYYPTSSVSVDFRIDSSFYFDSRFAWCLIYVKQNGVEVLMYQELVETKVWHSTPVNPLSFPNLGYNEPVEVKLVAISQNPPHNQATKSGFFLVYKEGLSNRYGSISYQSSVQLNDYLQTPFFSNGDCSSIASSTYLFKKFKVEYTLNGNFDDSIPVVIPNLCMGHSGAVPNTQERWGYKTSQSSTQATLINFVFDGYNIAGQYVGWRPSDIPHARIVYKYVKKPVIYPPIQYPTQISPQHNVGIFAGNLLQGNGDLRYQWSDSFNTMGHQLIDLGETIPYAVFIANLSTNFGDAPPYNIRSQVYNEAGLSGWKDLRVRFGADPHGCPSYAYIHKGDTLIENSLFIESGGNSNNDVTDPFLTECPLYPGEDSIKFSIIENTNDVTYLDQIEMFQVKVTKGKQVAVDGNGTVISYTPDQLFNKAVLNQSEDISEEMRNPDNEVVNFRKNDKIELFLEPDNNRSYLIIRMDNSGIKVNDALNITTSNGESIKIKARNKLSNICTELKKPGFNSIELLALEDAVVDMIMLVSNDKEHEVNKLELLDARNKNESIKKHIASIDKTYAVITKESGADFIFENLKDNDKSLYYYINVTGRYKSNDNSNIKATEVPQEKFDFRLSENTPNPFNPVTTIKYEIPDKGLVKMKVYDISGREIKTLINEIKTAGVYEITFDGSDLASGVYFYKLQTQHKTATKRMILIK